MKFFKLFDFKNVFGLSSFCPFRESEGNECDNLYYI